MGLSRGKIRNCHFQGEVISSGVAGGLVGRTEEQPSIMAELNDSSSSGSIQGNSRVGGLVGQADTLVVQRSFSNSTVTGTGNQVDGPIDRLFNSLVLSGTAQGQVTGKEQIGLTKSASLERVQASGDVSGDEALDLTEESTEIFSSALHDPTTTRDLSLSFWPRHDAVAAKRPTEPSP